MWIVSNGAGVRNDVWRLWGRGGVGRRADAARLWTAAIGNARLMLAPYLRGDGRDAVNACFGKAVIPQRKSIVDLRCGIVFLNGLTGR